MDRSPGFGSTKCYYVALFRLAFATPPVHKTLSLQHSVTRRTIMQKVRRHPFIPEGMHRAPTACKFMILGSISLPFRGSFQRSLTVLSTFGQIGVFRLSPWSGQIPAGFPVPRSTWDTSRVLEDFTYRTFTFFGVTSQTLLLSRWIPR